MRHSLFRHNDLDFWPFDLKIAKLVTHDVSNLFFLTDTQIPGAGFRTYSHCYRYFVNYQFSAQNAIRWHPGLSVVTFIVDHQPTRTTWLSDNLLLFIPRMAL